MKRLLYIVGLICISFLDLLGQTKESKELLKGLIGTDFRELGELNSKNYCDVIALNEEVERAMIYNDSAVYSIKYWLSNDIDFKKAKLIEFETIKIDTGKTQSVWVNLVRVWTKEDGSKVWNFDKSEIQVKLPTTFCSYVGIQKLTGGVKEKVVDNPLTCKPITIKLKRKSIDKDDVVVAYFESDDKVYIAFYKR